MAADESNPDRDLSGERPSDMRPAGEVDYELTAKDAGWRTPTLFVSRARVRVLNPPRPIKRRDHVNDDIHYDGEE